MPLHVCVDVAAGEIVQHTVFVEEAKDVVPRQLEQLGEQPREARIAKPSLMALAALAEKSNSTMLGVVCRWRCVSVVTP